MSADFSSMQDQFLYVNTEFVSFPYNFAQEFHGALFTGSVPDHNFLIIFAPNLELRELNFWRAVLFSCLIVIARSKV